jgi:CRISPR-associated endonuclease/helicase Cas3
MNTPSDLSAGTSSGDEPGRRFWAKTTADGTPGVSVYEHMLNVGCVAAEVASTQPGLLDRFGLSRTQVAALAALHDLGKISPGFQRKSEAWLVANNLVRVDRNNCWDTSMEPNHGKVTQAAVQAFFATKGMSSKAAPYVAALLGAHHGRIQKTPDSRPFVLSGISESGSGIDWDRERNLLAQAVLDSLGRDLLDLKLTNSDPALWWLAGLTTVSDWIGSDERHFPAEGGMGDARRRDQVRATVEEIGFGTPPIRAGLGFVDLFGFEPNDMQVRTRDVIKGPGIYVIEAPMGMGKTEAALWASYELLSAGKARGLYFALPTQATSNRIHLRMNDFVSRISPESGSSRLIHGTSWLVQKQPSLTPAATGGTHEEDARTGSDWFASTKRALLAPFGVGTVDQALLGVVAAKHFFVRRFALAGKVVILDEIHSYDLYTGTLIDELVKCLRGLGCTIIVLSATLTSKRRQQLVAVESDSREDPLNRPYPMISAAAENQVPAMTPAEPPKAKTVQVSFLPTQAALEQATTLAEAGGTVLWICDTVGTAQAQFRQIQQRSNGQFKVGLLHSRFPFWRREELETEWMERLGKDGKGRCGCVLVSTQIVEQSVDLDADLLITELAPTDMLLQRMGRLWRHHRPGRTGAPEMIILEERETLQRFREIGPVAIKKALGVKAMVYSPYVLLRSLEVWKSTTHITIPGEIRQRIESTYEERDPDTEPKAWRELCDADLGNLLARKALALSASNIWMPALNDDEGVQTRLNDVPTVSVVLCKDVAGKQITFLDGTVDDIDSDRFELPLAQKLHKNLVKVPRHEFATVKPFPGFERYLYKTQTMGLVQGDAIVTDGLKDGVDLRWSLEEGVAIMANSSRSEE